VLGRGQKARRLWRSLPAGEPSDVHQFMLGPPTVKEGAARAASFISIICREPPVHLAARDVAAGGGLGGDAGQIEAFKKRRVGGSTGCIERQRRSQL